MAGDAHGLDPRADGARDAAPFVAAEHVDAPLLLLSRRRLPPLHRRLHGVPLVATTRPARRCTPPSLPPRCSRASRRRRDGGRRSPAPVAVAAALAETFKLISILATAMVATLLAPQFFADLAPAPHPRPPRPSSARPPAAARRGCGASAHWPRGATRSARCSPPSLAAGYLDVWRRVRRLRTQQLRNQRRSRAAGAHRGPPRVALSCPAVPGHVRPCPASYAMPHPGPLGVPDADSRLCGLPRRRRASRWADRSSARTRCFTRACATSSARRCARATYPHRASPPRSAPSASRQLLPSHSPTSAPSPPSRVPSSPIASPTSFPLSCSRPFSPAAPLLVAPLGRAEASRGVSGWS